MLKTGAFSMSAANRQSAHAKTASNAVPLIERRMIEAEAYARVFDAVARVHGEPAATAIVVEAVEAAAFQAGRAFAATAAGGPSLAHFMTVLDVWRASGALDVGPVQSSEREFSFTVSRCDYVARYRAMNMPTPLVGLLSCRRDAAFARGYSPLLRMERPESIGEGCKRCQFRFIWTEERATSGS
jgi:hypothetical protein